MNTAADRMTVRNQVSEAEWELRVDLAACYRLIAMFGWDDLVFTHISARVPGPDDHFLINAYGLLFEEMTASSLVKVDLDGEIVLDTPHAVNPAGFTFTARSTPRARTWDVCCTRTPNPASQYRRRPTGLLPISQISLFPYASLAYHDYEGHRAQRRREAATRCRSRRQECTHPAQPRFADHGRDDCRRVPDDVRTGNGLPDADRWRSRVVANSSRCPAPIVDRHPGAGGDRLLKGTGWPLVWPGLFASSIV